MKQEIKRGACSLGTVDEMREAIRGELDKLNQNSLNECTDSLPGEIEKTHQLKQHRGLMARHKSVGLIRLSHQKRMAIGSFGWNM